MKFPRNLSIFLTVLGPSVITTMAGNDAGGVVTYSLAGARLGYAALITLPLLTVLYAMTQEMGSRIAIVTGKGLGDIIREWFGVKRAFLVFALLLIANFGSILTNVAGLKMASDMLGIPPIPFILGIIAASFLLVTKTKYERSQQVFLGGMIFYIAYIFSAVKGNPHWGEAIQGMFIPHAGMFSKEFLVMSIAVLGTTITPWGQFFVQSYMKDKNVPIRRLDFARGEAYLGAIASNFFTFFIMVATAATLYVNSIPLESGEQAALAIRPFAGTFASLLFAVGLVYAAMIGMTVVSLTSAYVFTEFFGFSGSLDESYHQGKIFYGTFIFNLLIATVLVITPFFPLFKIVLYTQSLNGILLPIFFYFLLKIINHPELMKGYTNGFFLNCLAVGAALFIVVAGVAAAALALFF